MNLNNPTLDYFIGQLAYVHKILLLGLFLILIGPNSVYGQNTVTVTQEFIDQFSKEDLSENSRYLLLIELCQKSLEYRASWSHLSNTKHLYREALEKALTNGNTEDKIWAQSAYAWTLKHLNDYRASIEYLDEAMRLAQDVKEEFPYGLAMVFREKAITHYKLAEYGVMLHHAQQSVEISKKNNFHKMEIVSLIDVGWAQFYQGNFELSSKSFAESRSLGESHNIFVHNNRIGLAKSYLEYGELQRAESIMLELLDHAESESDYYHISLCRWNLADIYNRMGRHERALEQALESIKADNKEEEDTPRNLGYAYLHASTASVAIGDLESALLYGTEALEINTREKNRALQSTIENDLGQIYSKLGRYDQAIIHLENCLSLTSESGNKGLAAEAQKNLANVYDANNDHQNANKAYRAFINLNEQVFNENKSKVVAEIRAQFEIDKAEIENENLKAQNKFISSQNQLFLWGAVLLSIFLGLLSYLFLQNRRVNRKLSLQNKTIAAQHGQLKELDRAKSNFFANITHEFRTPLTLIMGPAKKLLQTKDRDTRANASLIDKNSRQLLQLVNQLLDLTKLDEGKLELQVRHGNLQAVLQNCYHNFRSLAEEKGVQFKLKIDPEIPESSFDQSKIEMIINNLLSNAMNLPHQEARSYWRPE